MTNITTSQGLIQLLVKDRRPFQVTGYTLLPTIQFAEFRSDDTYITIYVMWLHLLFNSIIPFIILLSIGIILGEFDPTYYANEVNFHFMASSS